MKIYKEARLVVEEETYGEVNHFKITPLTRNGKKSKRYSQYITNGRYVTSSSTFAKYERQIGTEFFLSPSIKRLIGLFPKALCVFVKGKNQSDGDITILENDCGYVTIRCSISESFEITDNIIISYTKNGVDILSLIDLNHIMFGDKLHVGDYEAILSTNWKGRRDDYKKIYYIDTKTAMIKKTRRFFDGVEL